MCLYSLVRAGRHLLVIFWAFQVFGSILADQSLCGQWKSSPPGFLYFGEKTPGGISPYYLFDRNCSGYEIRREAFHTPAHARHTSGLPSDLPSFWLNLSDAKPLVFLACANRIKLEHKPIVGLHYYTFSQNVGTHGGSMLWLALDGSLETIAFGGMKHITSQLHEMALLERAPSPVIISSPSGEGLYFLDDAQQQLTAYSIWQKAVGDGYRVVLEKTVHGKYGKPELAKIQLPSCQGKIDCGHYWEDETLLGFSNEARKVYVYKAGQEKVSEVIDYWEFIRECPGEEGPPEETDAPVSEWTTRDLATQSFVGRFLDSIKPTTALLSLAVFLFAFCAVCLTISAVRRKKGSLSYVNAHASTIDTSSTLPTLSMSFSLKQKRTRQRIAKKWTRTPKKAPTTTGRHQERKKTANVKAVKLRHVKLKKKR